MSQQPNYSVVYWTELQCRLLDRITVSFSESSAGHVRHAAWAAPEHGNEWSSGSSVSAFAAEAQRLLVLADWQANLGLRNEMGNGGGVSGRQALHLQLRQVGLGGACNLLPFSSGCRRL